MIYQVEKYVKKKYFIKGGLYSEQSWESFLLCKLKKIFLVQKNKMGGLDKNLIQGVPKKNYDMF